MWMRRKTSAGHIQLAGLMFDTPALKPEIIPFPEDSFLEVSVWEPFVAGGIHAPSQADPME